MPWAISSTVPISPSICARGSRSSSTTRPRTTAEPLESAILALAEWADGSPERWIDGILDLGAYDIDTSDSFEFDSLVFNVIYHAGARGDFETAARLVDAVALHYRWRAAHLHGELAVQLAEAGREGEARSRLDTALGVADDPLTLIMAGNVAAATGAHVEAWNWYEDARAEARDLGDGDFEREALFHLEDTARVLDDDTAAGRFARDRRRLAPPEPARGRIVAQDTFTHADRSTFGRKVSRNEPCPCGSGRKYKRCHGTS